MSNFISHSVNIYNKLQKVYADSIYETLETPAEKIRSIFQHLIDSKAEQYGLKKGNSVYDTKYYYIKTRIKKPDSFYEKLVRKELGIKLTIALGLLSPDLDDTITQKKSEIVSTIQKLDDIIGLRVVTELKADCDRVYDLLLNSSDVFIKEDIRFENLQDQPGKMRNGLDIFRIKGTYQNLYGFELQIKSKINETWGDLDHILFYKDYSISPIRDTVQITMNNVGQLLDKIEGLLYDLRESDGNYDNAAEKLRIQKSLEDELCPLMKAKYGVNYNIREIAFYLHNFRQKINVGEQTLIDLSFDHLEIKPTKELLLNYWEIRRTSLVLMNLESIYVNWLQLKSVKVDQESLDQILEGYLENLISLSMPDSVVNDFDFEKYLKVLISYRCSADVFLVPQKHIPSITIYNRLKDLLSDLMYESPELLEAVLMLFCIHYFEGDYRAYLEWCRNEDLDLNFALISIKNQIQDTDSSPDEQINGICVSILEYLTEKQ